MKTRFSNIINWLQFKGNLRLPLDNVSNSETF